MVIFWAFSYEAKNMIPPHNKIKQFPYILGLNLNLNSVPYQPQLVYYFCWNVEMVDNPDYRALQNMLQLFKHKELDWNEQLLFLLKLREGLKKWNIPFMPSPPPNLMN